MIYVNAFLFTGIVCLIGQLILDNTKLTPGHITTIFVIVGSFLDIFNIYDKFILWAGGGALVPITSFGHLLIHGAMDTANDLGIMGLMTGMFDLTASGITSAIVFAFILSLIFKPKDWFYKKYGNKYCHIRKNVVQYNYIPWSSTQEAEEASLLRM